MSIKFWWHDEAKTIFVMQTIGNWTLQEYYAVFTEAVAEMERPQHPIILINDMSMSGAPPRNFLSTARSNKERKARNLKLTIMVGANLFVSRLVDILGKIMPGLVSNLKFVDTLEQAVATAEAAVAEVSFSL